MSCCWPGNGSGTPAWGTVLNFGYAQFSDPGNSKSILLYSLPRKGVIHGVTMKHRTKFEGGAITKVTGSVGVLGDLDRYLTSYDISTTVSDTEFAITHVLDSIDFGSIIPLQITLRSTGGPLNTLTVGSVDVWLLLSTLT